nr:F-box domain containing protein [Pandoravirus belohorizontensis]
MEGEPLRIFGRLSIETAARRRTRPVDFDALLADDACGPPARQRPRLDGGRSRWKRKRVADLFHDRGGDGIVGDGVDAVVSLMRKRLRVADAADDDDDDKQKDREADHRRQSRRHGGRARDAPLRDPFAMLPDELVLAVMAFCDAHALCRLACTSARLAGLASDNLLWRNLYAAALPPCTRYGLPCLADAVDAWCFVAGDRHGDDDGLDHGPSRRLPDPGVGAIDAGGTHVPGHAAQDVTNGGGCTMSRPATLSNTTGGANDALHARPLDRWWTHRCARLTRLAADRVTGSGNTLAHPACPHPPPSLVRAHGYRWAYAAAAMPPLVRKVHHGVGHVHCIVHRGARDGLASQCETCLAAADACGVVWRWGRFADCFLAGLGTEALATAPRDPCDDQPCAVTAGVWSQGVAYGVVVRRAAGAITIEGATAGAQWHDDPMDRDQANGPRHRAIDSRRPDSDDSDDDDDGKRSGQTHAAAVIYYAQEGGSNDAWSYAGERAGDQRDGYGALACEALALPVYEGDWRRDMWHGRGVLRIEGAAGGVSAVYTGRFVRGRPCGRGVLDLGDGTCVEASWHSLPDGSVAPRHTGHVAYANGDRVLCDWGRPTLAVTRGHSVAHGTDVAAAVVVKGFQFAKRSGDPGGRAFAGREVGAEWGPWPTECADPTLVDPQAARPLPAQCGGNDVFCARGWTVVLPRLFWPPTTHPLEALFARYVDQDRIGWCGRRQPTRPRATRASFDPCAL